MNETPRHAFLMTAEQHAESWRAHQAAIAADRELSDLLAAQWAAELEEQPALRAA